MFNSNNGYSLADIAAATGNNNGFADRVAACIWNLKKCIKTRVLK